MDTIQFSRTLCISTAMRCVLQAFAHGEGELLSFFVTMLLSTRVPTLNVHCPFLSYPSSRLLSTVSPSHSWSCQEHQTILIFHADLPCRLSPISLLSENSKRLKSTILPPPLYLPLQMSTSPLFWSILPIPQYNAASHSWACRAHQTRHTLLFLPSLPPASTPKIKRSNRVRDRTTPCQPSLAVEIVEDRRRCIAQMRAKRDISFCLPRGLVCIRGCVLYMFAVSMMAGRLLWKCSKFCTSLACSAESLTELWLSMVLTGA